MKLALALLLALLAVVSAASSLAPNAPAARFNGLLNAPPTPVHLRDAAGQWHAPFIHPLKRLSQLEQTYQEDTSAIVPLRWFSAGRLVQSSQPEAAPLLILGADAFGRDVFSRTLHGGRLSLGIALIAALGRATPLDPAQRRLYETTVVHDDGVVRVLRDSRSPTWQPGDRVRVLMGRVAPERKPEYP